MRYLATAAMAAGVLLSNLSEARANSLVLAAQELTVDSDGDSVVDFLDNAPGVANNQADTDADGIGDVIDPTPSLSNPNLGDPGLGVSSSPPILTGGTATFDYLMTLATPPGSFGRIELDFDLDNTTDAVFFGPLTAGINTISIPANFFVNASWDLNTPGLYTVGMKAYAPACNRRIGPIPMSAFRPSPNHRPFPCSRRRACC